MPPLLRIWLCLALVLNSAGLPAFSQQTAADASPEPAIRRIGSGTTIRGDLPPAPLSKESAARIAALEAGVAAVCPGDWKKDPCSTANSFIRDLKKSCAEWNQDCAVAGKVFARELDIAGKVALCARQECRGAGLYELAGFQTRISRALLNMPPDQKPDTLWLWSFSRDLEAAFTEVLLKAVDADIGEMDAEIKRLETWTELLKKSASAGSQRDAARVQSLGVDGQGIFERFQSLSRGIDHTVSASQEENKAALRERRRSANKIARRLAKLRDYLILLQQRTRQTPSEKLDISKVYDPSVDTAEDAEGPKFKGSKAKVDLSGISRTFQGREGPGQLPDGGSVPPSTAGNGTSNGSEPANHPLVNATPKKTLLDVPGAVDKLPKLAGTIVEPPSIEGTGPDGVLDTVSRLAGKQGERKAADAMRRLGLSRTVGRPGNFAPLVHAQEADTCALVTQQQLLAAYGLIDQTDPKAAELRLKDEAFKKGYFFNGTAPQYAGSLLVDHGLLVSKRSDTKTQDLDKVLLTGKPAIVDVDARYLWGLTEKINRPLGHSIIITGAEVSKFGGKVLGYYYNDSGADPPKGGGFITAADFRKAFESRGGNFIEVQ